MTALIIIAIWILSFAYSMLSIKLWIEKNPGISRDDISVLVLWGVPFAPFLCFTIFMLQLFYGIHVFLIEPLDSIGQKVATWLGAKSKEELKAIEKKQEEYDEELDFDDSEEDCDCRDCESCDYCEEFEDCDEGEDCEGCHVCGEEEDDDGVKPLDNQVNKP
jgi:hypothetical protein